MSHISDSEISENGNYIFRRLPGWMPTNRHSGNFKLLDTVGHEIDRLDRDIQDIYNATTVQDAETIDQIEELAKLVTLPPDQNEGKEEYRSRVIAEFQSLSNEGTPSELVENIATLLGVESNRIDYNKVEHGVVQVTVPGNALDNLSISSSEFVDIAGDLIAAGFNLKAIRRGTFTYITPNTYNNNNSDPTLGYDGLDSNGNQKNNGGTYAGLIE